jgi:hypothetical protein
MNKFLSAISILGAAAAALQVTAPAALARQVQVEYIQGDLSVTKWIGIAASPNGKVFEVADQSSEAIARGGAKFECEQVTGRTCAAIAVPMTWDVVVMRCARPGQSPIPIVAGSGQNAAIEVALDKAAAAGVPPGRCTQIYEY